MAKVEKAAKGKGEEKKKKKGWKMLIIVMIPLILLGAAAAYYFLFGSGNNVKKQITALPPVVYNFGPITTNLDDGHVVQAQMTFQFKAGTSTTPLQSQKAQIMNDAIEEFSSWSYSSLLPSSGKAEFARQLIATLNQLFAHDAGKPKIQQVYFTQFIMQ